MITQGRRHLQVALGVIVHIRGRPERKVLTRDRRGVSFEHRNSGKSGTSAAGKEKDMNSSHGLRIGALALTSRAAWARENPGRISGGFVDSSGGIVPAASVRATNAETGVV